MKNNKSISLLARVKSIGFAISGIIALLKSEPNAWIHTLATIGVIAAGIVRQLDAMQWIAIVFAIGLVWVAEALNTAIEKLCDYCCNNTLHPAIKVVKDIAAGAVMIASLTSIAIGIIVFFF